MSNLINVTKQATMSSREIAELTGKEHKNVLADIRTMLDALGLGWAEFSAQYKDGTGRTLPMFSLPKDLTITLVSGYNVQMRHRIVTRWQELEAQVQPAFAIPTNMAEALRLAADLAEEKAKAEAALEEAKPKLAALNRIAVADGSLCITDAAKNLQIRPKDLFAWLSAHQWIYRRTGSAHWVAYQALIQRGMLEHKVSTIPRSDGTEKISESVRVTPKGMAAIATAFGKGGDHGRAAA